MSEKLVINSFVSPESRDPKGVDLSNDLVKVFQLVDEVQIGPSGDKHDFVLKKKPVKVDEYHLNKVIAERVKGQDLKSIIARCEQTGDYSTLSQRKVIFGDGVLTPKSIGDAKEAAEKGAEFLDTLSKEDIKKFYDLSKGSKEDLEAYIQKCVDERLAAIKPVVKEGEQNE